MKLKRKLYENERNKLFNEINLTLLNTTDEQIMKTMLNNTDNLIVKNIAKYNYDCFNIREKNI